MGIDTIEFYWRPGCPFCAILRGRLRESGLPVREINIWEDSDAAARVRSVNQGNETVPTVFIGDRALVNPSMDELTAVIEREAPELFDLAQPAAQGHGSRH
ncbi:glutaredoxin family protein [Saccharomonospora azurea]|uniref:Glutaredoxin-like protein n=1 Tax=Saccharomonospora azurea NA-128 TaxID=882081 RepID=H8G824_9PSEU|nr:glutaredoxin domain-containing protein [Saccharomonospora azurea]EHK89249.1 glutaredoxin-like protein [Saccharomonospora azurea SZMC 14600]EHY89376.1 glutaredoxin-like protein [Saccharomonospora azurea NA-128]